MSAISESVRRNTARLLPALCAIALPAIAEPTAQQCETWWNDYLAYQNETLQLHQVLPFAEQFDLVQRTIIEIDDALSGASQDLETASEKLTVLREYTIGSHDELSEALQSPVWARSAARAPEAPTPSEETGFSLSEWLNKVAGGAGDAAELTAEIQEITGRSREALDTLEIALDARDQPPSKQLEAFADYFSAVTNGLEPLVKGIPGLEQLFDAYEDAIRGISVSVATIEERWQELDRILKKHGFEDVSYMPTSPTVSQKLGEAINAAERNLEATAERLADCDRRFNPYSKARADVRYARDYADDMCRSIYLEDIDAAGEMLSQRLRDLERSYPKPTFFDRSKHGPILGSHGQLEIAKREHREWLEANQDELDSSKAAERKHRAARINVAVDAQNKLDKLIETRDECRRSWLEAMAEEDNIPRRHLQRMNRDLYPNWHRDLLDAELFVSQWPIRITSLAYTTKVVSGGERGDATVYWSGRPGDSVTLVFRPRSCYPGNCTAPRREFDGPPMPLVAPDMVWCYGIDEKTEFDFEFVLIGSSGYESEPFAAPFTCLPAPR